MGSAFAYGTKRDDSSQSRGDRMPQATFLRQGYGMAGTPAATAVDLFIGDHETFNRLAPNESIYNFWDVRGRDMSIKKVIGFD